MFGIPFLYKKPYLNNNFGLSAKNISAFPYTMISANILLYESYLFSMILVSLIFFKMIK